MSEALLVLDEVPDASGRQVWADWLGMAASIGCAIHCAAMPMVIAYLPALGLSWLADEGFHRWMAAICFGLAALAFLPGWKKHRSLVPFFLGGIGVLLLSVAAYGLEEGCCPSCVDLQEQTVQEPACEDPTCTACDKDTGCDKEIEADPEEARSAGLLDTLTPLITPLGGVFLVLGHIVNHRRSCSCRGNGCCLDSVEQETAE